MGVVDAAAEAEEAAGLSRRANHKALKLETKRGERKNYHYQIVAKKKKSEKLIKSVLERKRAPKTQYIPSSKSFLYIKNILPKYKDK